MFLPFSLTKYMRFPVWLLYTLFQFCFFLFCSFTLARSSISILFISLQWPKNIGSIFLQLQLMWPIFFFFFFFKYSFSFGSNIFVCVCAYIRECEVAHHIHRDPFLPLIHTCRCIFVRFVREYYSSTYYSSCVVHCCFFCLYFFLSFFWFILIELLVTCTPYICVVVHFVFFSRLSLFHSPFTCDAILNICILKTLLSNRNIVLSATCSQILQRIGQTNSSRLELI